MYIERNLETGDIDVCRDGRVYRTIYFDMHSNKYRVTGSDKEFNNYDDARYLAVNLVLSDVIEEERSEEVKRVMTKDEIIEEQEAVIKVHEGTIGRLKKELRELKSSLETDYLKLEEFHLTKTFKQDLKVGGNQRTYKFIKIGRN